jgi:hypothetical protein
MGAVSLGPILSPFFDEEASTGDQVLESREDFVFVKP